MKNFRLLWHHSALKLNGTFRYQQLFMKSFFAHFRSPKKLGTKQKLYKKLRKTLL